MIEKILEYLYSQSCIVHCGKYNDYLLKSFFHNPQGYMVYNTYFEPKDIKKIVFKNNDYPEIILK